MRPERVRLLADKQQRAGPVVYWMSRDQRADDNWALLYAQQRAIELQAPLAVVFCLAPTFLHAAERTSVFMLTGLAETEQRLRSCAIPFILRTGDPRQEIPACCAALQAALLVTDFDPLRIKSHWKAGVARAISVPFLEVDAHNIVPCWLASPKSEYAARTFRPKLHRQLDAYLDQFPPLQRHPFTLKKKPASMTIAAAQQQIRPPTAAAALHWPDSGAAAARRALRHFITKKLSRYADDRNDPLKDCQSGLSPYLHFGMIAAQRVAQEVVRSAAAPQAAETFLDQLIVWREIADNYCFYTPQYDAFEGFPAWAQKTLNAHRRDLRKPHYTPRQFEQAETHDPLWNAAQKELVVRGRIHGYVRMYWAKMLLAWAASPEEAQATAVYLNDRYALDGRDPNGYANIAWSIGGLHDRPWFDRPATGMIRTMSAAGMARKFDVTAYSRAMEKL
jgi:deoxyribodipyrimidine photo-lyase